MKQPFIQMREVNKFYPLDKDRFQALKGINLTIEEGEFVAIRGRSGAGKSTLLHILGCLDGFDEGSYTLNGREVKGLGDGKSARLRNETIGFVLQDFSLVDYRSVLFNVSLPLYFGKYPSRKMKAKAMEMLKLVGLEDQAKKKANQLSGGQRQRVAIARAMVTDPKLILADEPTGALDSRTAGEIMELLQPLNRRGVTVVVVTHDDVVESYARRVVTMSDGEIVD